MAKNFVEEGKTVAIVASAAISSGDLVQVGDVFAVALTDIPQGETGDVLTEGVFMLPKLKTDDMKTGGFAPIFPDICYHLTHYRP
ncbi:DUF2190 family protein, partial [Escherichia coli]|nr:DUF2190 family protein [Escherichia coli]